MAQVWKPGVLKANMPEHVLVRFTVANVMPGWDPRWLDELLGKTEETLRTPAHPLVEAYGPFSPTKLDSSRLSMLMQGVASALVAAKKKEKEEGTSAQKATAKKEAAAPPSKEEDEEEVEELDEEDEEEEAEEGDSGDDDSDDDNAAKSPHWFVVRWLHIEQAAIFRELVQRKLLNQAKAKRRLDAMDLEEESIEGLREKMAERQRKLMDVVNDVLDAKVEREGGKRECAVQVLSDVKDKAGRFLFEEIDRQMEDNFNFNINEYALRDSQDYEEEELWEKVERIVESHGRKATLACPVHARNFRSLLEEWARVFGSDKMFEMLAETMGEVEEAVEEDALDGVRATTERRMNASVEQVGKESGRHALLKEMKRREIVPTPESDSTALREFDSDADSDFEKEEINEVRLRRFVHLSEVAYFWGMVRRKFMPQSMAITVLKQMDEQCHGNEAKKTWFLRAIFQQMGEKGLIGKDELQEISLEEWSRKTQLEVQRAAERDLWSDFLKLAECKLEEYIREQGLRKLGYEEEEREDVDHEEEAVDPMKMDLYYDMRIQEKFACLFDDPEGFRFVSGVRILFSGLARSWGVVAIKRCMDAVVHGLELTLEEHALGGDDRRKITVEARKLALPEKEEREKREKGKVNEVYWKKNKERVDAMEKAAAGLRRGDGAAGTEADRKEDGYTALEAEMQKNMLRKKKERKEEEAAAAAARAAAREQAKAKANAQAGADARTAARMRQRQEEEEEEARRRLRVVAHAKAKKAAGTSKKTKAAAAAEDEDDDDDFEEEEDLLEWMKQSAQVALDESRRKKGTATSTTTLLSPPPMGSGHKFSRASREGAAAAGGGGSKVAPLVPGEVKLTRPSMDRGRETGAAAAATAAAAAAAIAASGRPPPVLASDGWVDSTGEAASGSPTEGTTKKNKKKKKTKKKKKQQGGTRTDLPMGGVGDGDGGGEEEEGDDEDEDEVDARVLALVRAAAPVAVSTPAVAFAPTVAPAPPVPVGVIPAAQALAGGGGGGGGGEGNRPGTVAGRAAAAMVARARVKQQKEEEEARRKKEEEEEGGDSTDEDEVFAAALKATAARMGKLGKVEGAQGGGGKKGPSPPPAAKVFNEENIPSEYVCPISFGIMYDPVIATDGHSYERAAIEKWIETRLRKGQPITSPFTNDLMDRNSIPNRALRNLIRAFCEEHSLPIPTGPAVYTMG